MPCMCWYDPPEESKKLIKTLCQKLDSYLMQITCVSDLHGHFPKLEGGDLLIVAGDLTARDTPLEYGHFGCWMDRQKYKKKILIGGNHDNYFDRKGFEFIKDVYAGIDVDYLCDSGTEFEYESECPPPEGMEGLDVAHTKKKKLKIWGSPWTKTFPGMNPKCKAFTVETEEELAEKWAMIPDDVDILVTHSPAYGIKDGPNAETRLGSTSLLRWVANHVNTLQMHVCGHIHEGYGAFDIREAVKKCGDPRIPVYINASHVDEKYRPVNKPIRIEL